MRRIKIIVITSDKPLEHEAEAISRILDSGAAHRVHIRKPAYSESDTRALLDSIPSRLWPKLSLHDHHALAPEYGTGIHLNSRNPQAPAGFAGTVSRSCHSLEESRGAADYVFISPVFDSISKAGYTAAFSLDELRGKVDSRCIALGGVEPCRLSQVADAGFGGAALLGYIWRDFSISELDKRINTLKTICSSL